MTPISAILAGESDEKTLARIEEQGFIYSTDPALSYEKDKKLIISPSYGEGPGMGQQAGHFQGDPSYKAQFGAISFETVPFVRMGWKQSSRKEIFPF